jgi:hypothetical protein
MKNITVNVRPPLPRKAFFFLVVFSAALNIGCRSANSVDLIETQQVIPETVASKLVRLVKPSIWTEDGNMVVYGIVHRQTQMNAPLEGHVDVWILSPDGKQSVHLLATPTTLRIPQKGPRSSSFRARYNGIPPAGSIVRVEYRNRSHHEDEVLAVKSE